MTMNNKILLTIAVAFLLGLALGAFVGKDKDLKEAIANLTVARASLEEAHQHLDRTLQLNQDLEKRNDDFGRYLQALDSITKSNEAVAMHKEAKLLNTLARVNASVRELKERMATSAHLPLLPVGEMEEGN